MPASRNAFPILPTGPLFLVMCDHGKFGREGISKPEWSRRNVIEDIASGQISGVDYVLEINIADGTTRDITEDLAGEVADHSAATGDQLSQSTLEWISLYRGNRAAYALGMEAA